MYINKLVILSISILAAFFFVSCGPVPFYQVTGGYADANVVWRDGVASRSLSRSLIAGVSRAQTLATDPVIQQTYDDFYTSLGTRIHQLTPTKFQLSADVSLPGDPPLFLAREDEPVDFGDANSASRIRKLSKAVFNHLLLELNTNDMETIFGFEEEPFKTIIVESSVIAELPPGYDALWGDLIGSSSPTPIFGKTFWSRRNLSGDQFHFSLSFIEPAVYPKPEQFIFGPYSQVAFVDEDYLLSLYGEYSSHFAPDSGGGIIVPWEGFTASSDNIEVEMYLDLNGIVEIYDNNTLGDLSDDHVVLAKSYWERFSLNIVQY